MKKRIISLLLVIVLALGCFPCMTASAATVTQKHAVTSLLKSARFTQNDANTVGGWVELGYYVDLILDTDNFVPDAPCSNVYYNALRTRSTVLTRQNRTSKIPVYPFVKVEDQPTDTAGKLGDEISLSAAASLSNGTETVYQWYCCTDENKTNATPIEGATSETLTVTPTQCGVFYYFCRISAKTAANVEALDTDVVCVTVRLTGICVITQPEDLNPDRGSEASLTAAASAPDGVAVSYQWYSCADKDKTDAAPIEGATDATYTVPTDMYGDYYYFCRISADYGESVDSAVATILIPLVYTYYSTWDSAITDANNGTIGENADAEKENAVACIYLDNNNVANAVLLRDAETAGMEIAKDMVINLNGHKLSMTEGNNTSAIHHTIGTLVVDGTKKGSSIEVKNSDKTARCIRADAGTLTVNGGTYVATSGKSARPIQVDYDCTATITDCEITAFGGEKTSSGGVLNWGTATLTNCRVSAYANYNTDQGEYSMGVYGDGPLILNNCYAYGTHSSVQCRNTLVINGGTYESPGHGVYISCTDKIAHIRNATIRFCEMKEGYIYTKGATGPGLYIGGGSDRNNITLYMDNCVISSKEGEPQIVLRGTSNEPEHDNNLYISNSTLLGEKFYIRIDNLTHRLYLGAGNNFNKENTTIKALYDPNSMLPAVIETGETYDSIP